MLNKAGLSKDNFQDSDAKHHAKQADESGGASPEESSGAKRKISDYFSSSFLEGVDVEMWDEDDEFWKEEEEEEEEEDDDDKSPDKKFKPEGVSEHQH